MQDRIHFNSIESSCDESVFLKAEELYDSGSVVHVSQADKKKWSVQVKDSNKTCSLNLTILGNSHFGSSECDCHISNQYTYCAHIVAAMIAVRSRIANMRQSAEIIHPKTQRQHKNSYNNLLNAATREQLIDFTRKFGSKNKRFFYELSFSLIGQQEDNISSSLYNEYLERLSREITANEQISNSNKNFYLKICQSILADLDYQITLTAYVRAFDILKPLWEYSLIVRKKISDPDDLNDLIKILEETTINFVQSIKSPELLKICYKELKEISILSYYPVLSPEKNLIFLLLTHKQFSPFIKTDESELIKYLLNFRIISLHRIKTYFNFLITKAKSIQLFENNRDYLARKGIIQYVANKTYYADLNNKTKIDLLNLFYSCADSTFEQKRISILTIDILLDKNEFEIALQYGIKYYEKFRDFGQLLALTRLDKFNMQIFEEILVNDQVVSEVNANNLRIYFKLYYSNTKEIEESLYRDGSLELLSKLDHNILLAKKIDISHLYIQLIQKHLKDHLGPEARKYILDIVHPLVHKGLVIEHGHIIDACQDAFPAMRSNII